ncbi:hypothetical protein BHAOGJBA_5014 [Methylobacterium hispanicum]|uniref:Uncharacterized protein n=1 Tax=Methylobacterium hispanicum TaxID=270350 RepID=A0AAV4ZUE6_9HYPH|nr:hypothetical protein [Methylobacterium hispanicum]GJD91466.1 hypothetical protein BHAOGJBA_5014 [Methylobacterium hispanicum]
MTQASGPEQDLPVLRYSTAGQPRDQAVETWRALMRLMYGIEPAARDAQGRAPGGGIAVHRVGMLLANRTVWHGQHVARDRRLADPTPDHIAFQFCRSGSYHGDIAGSTASLLPGTVVVANRRRMLAGRLAADTIGLVVPRHLVAGSTPTPSRSGSTRPETGCSVRASSSCIAPCRARGPRTCQPSKPS